MSHIEKPILFQKVQDLSGSEIRGVITVRGRVLYFTDTAIYSYGPLPSRWERFKLWIAKKFIQA